MQEIQKIPISAINQYVYCPRRCFLIHVEGEFTDNVHTLRGTIEHERVDQNGYDSGNALKVEYALPVWSDKHGLTGRCDVVEFHEDGSIYPVEYKHGKRQRWSNDDMQLTAQVLCLEEMFSKDICNGAIYHQGSRRRREVVIDHKLRQSVETILLKIRQLMDELKRPEPITKKERCRECSLRDICQPEWNHSTTRIKRLHSKLFNIEEEK